MNKIIFFSIFLILPKQLLCPAEIETPEVFYRQEYDLDQVHELDRESPFEQKSSDIFKDADVNRLLETPDIIPVQPEDHLLQQEVQLIQPDDKNVATVTTTIDPLALDVGSVQVADQLDKKTFFNDIYTLISQWDIFIKNSEDALYNLQGAQNALYVDYARVIESIDHYVSRIVNLQNSMIDFDYSEEEQKKIEFYQNALDDKLQSCHDLLVQLQSAVGKKAFNDIPMLYKKVQDLQVSFGKINKNSWFGGKSLSDVAAELNELHVLLDNALVVVPDISYKDTVQSMKDVINMLDQNLMKIQLDALHQKDLINRSYKAIQILESQPSSGYTASKRGIAEIKDAGSVLKALDAILLDDPLYRDRYLQAHDYLAFERLNDALDKKGIERKSGETEEEFLKRLEVQSIIKELFSKKLQAGSWKDSLDFNVALANATYLRKIYEEKKGIPKLLALSVGGRANLKRLVREANLRFTSEKRSTKVDFFPVQDSMQRSDSIVSISE